MKLRGRIGRAAAAALVLCFVLPPAAAAETAGLHTHTWRTDWAADSRCHWHGCADPACRTLVPAWAEGYAYHIYDDIHDPDCNVCGWIRAVDPGHTHTWDSGWNSDSTHHWHQCIDGTCPGVVPAWAEGYAAHVYSSPGDTNCNICGRTRFVVPGHIHTWSDQWTGDGLSHWYTCTDPDCPGVVPSQTKGYAVHSYDGPEDTSCNICGRARSVDPNHIHTWGDQWSSNEYSHWYQCTGGGCPGVAPSQAKGYALHVYDGPEDTDCNICGQTRVVFPLSSGLLTAPPVPESDVTVTGRGRVYARPANAQAGSRITVILTPGEHYAAGTLTVTGHSGAQVTADNNGDGTWTFIQPGEPVRFRVVFLPAYQVCPRDGSCPLAGYGDLSPAAWYHDGIHYCLDWALMGGYDPASFAPGDGLSGAMMAQMLYNLAGRPELPAVSGYQSTGAWYDSAVIWAVGAGVLNVDDGFWKFSPTEDVTREQLVLMLWRFAGRPLPEEQTLPFPDAGTASRWAEAALRWAVDRGILQGRDGLLAPGGKVTRAEAASVLVRYLESQT